MKDIELRTSLGPNILAMEKERDGIERRIKRIAAPVKVEKETKAVVQRLTDLRRELDQAQPERIRAIWKTFIRSVTLWWEVKYEEKPRTRYKIKRGEIVLGTDYDVSPVNNMRNRAPCVFGGT